MSRLLALGLVAVMVSSVSAGGNPDVRIYIDFDPPNYVHSIEPEVYTAARAHVCLDQIGDGVSSVSFRLPDLATDCPGVFAPASWVCNWYHCGFMPSYDGNVVAANLECVHGEPSVVVFADLFYLGGECCVGIRDHTDYPRWVVDCSDPGQVDFYCLLSRGSVGGGLCPEGDCPPVPVEPGTWGTIKSLYR